MSKKEKDSPCLYYSYSEKTIVVSDDYGVRGEYTGSTETETISKLTGVSREKPQGYLWRYVPVKDAKSEEEIGDQVSVVVVIYSTGGTFSYESGRLTVEGIYLDHDRACKVAKSIRDETYKDYGPWQGYFESLQEVYVQLEDVNNVPRVTRF